jgi:acyl-CoA synthetase (NDP forming)
LSRPGPDRGHDSPVDSCPTVDRFDLHRLLAPRSIAVVGANDRMETYAAQALANLSATGYSGQVWGINPNRSEVLGRPCVATLADLPEPADAVVVAIPAAGVAAIIDQAGATGCGGAVVFSAGFAEVPGGAGHQRELVAAAARYRLPVCGPNCNGIVAPHAGTVLWGDALPPLQPGPVGLVSQSGNVAVNALSSRRGLRFHTVIASGNQAVLSVADYLEFLAGEPGLGAIALYLEDDGGPRVCDGLAACAEADIRVAVLKVGRTRAGALAAAAHSGALAGDQRVFQALVAEAGAVWADDVHDLLELAKTMAVRSASRANRPAGRGLAIMTCSGGDSAQGADEAQRLGLDLPALAPATRADLARVLPPTATVANPLDYTAMIWGDSQALAELVRVLGVDPAIDQVLVFYDQPPELQGAPEQSWGAVREGIIAGAALSQVATIVSSTLPELLDDGSAWRFAQAGVPAAAGLRTGLRCAAAAVTQRGDPQRLRAIAETARRLAANARLGARWLSEHESKTLLRAGGLPVVDGRLVKDERDALASVAQLGAPIALKLSSPRIQHKSELSAVALGLNSAADVRSAFRRLSPLAHRHGAHVLAETMAAPGIELLVAARSDAIVPALVLGLGGIWTEMLDDVAIVALPAGAARIERALRSLRGAAVLEGARGAAPPDIGAAARLAQRAGELLLEQSLELIELNPVLVYAEGLGAVAVDASVRVRCADADLIEESAGADSAGVGVQPPGVAKSGGARGEPSTCMT